MWESQSAQGWMVSYSEGTRLCCELRTVQPQAAREGGCFPETGRNRTGKDEQYGMQTWRTWGFPSLNHIPQAGALPYSTDEAGHPSEQSGHLCHWPCPQARPGVSRAPAHLQHQAGPQGGFNKQLATGSGKRQ